MDTMWQEYGIEELEKGMQKLFPTFRISVTDLMTQILQGDILGAVGCLLKEVIREMSNSATGSSHCESRTNNYRITYILGKFQSTLNGIHDIGFGNRFVEFLH